MSHSSGSSVHAGHTPADDDQPPVAIIIPAKDEGGRIASTVRSAKYLPGVDLIVVVDDGSQDNTRFIARDAGAVTVRHTVNRGKASAMETGANVVAMHEAEGANPHLLLFLDADLGESAAEAAPLIEPVAGGGVDMTIAVFPPQKGAGGHGFVKNLSRKTIARETGWHPTAPLSGQRCMTREAYNAAQPFADGWGVETKMTIDVLRAGLTVQEVPCDFGHRVSKNDLRGQLHRLHQFIDVAKVSLAHRVASLSAKNQQLRKRARALKDRSSKESFEPYRMAK